MQSYKKLETGLLTILIAYFLTPGFAVSQASEQLPVPEYYGIYAVVSGKLVKLDAQQIRPEETVRVRLGQRNGVGNILQGSAVAGSTTAEIGKFGSDLKVIVFSQSSGVQSSLDIAKSLHLESLVFVRNLMVDTGWPNNVKRSGPENGWESGDAPELLVMGGGDRAKSLEFLMKPLPGHPDMVVAALAEKLKPGVYRLRVGEADPFSGRRGFLFAVDPVADGEISKCVDALVTYSMNMSNSKYTACGGVAHASNNTTSAAVPSSSNAPPSNSTVPSATCTSYDDCFHSGQIAFRSADWSQAIADFQMAEKNRPESGEPLEWIGNSHLAAGRISDAVEAWDKALTLSGRLLFSVCHERGMKRCEVGALTLNTEAVSFAVSGQRLFSELPSEIAVAGQTKSMFKSGASLSLRVKGQNYDFDFFPVNGACQTGSFLHCSEDGVRQQLALRNYISQAIPKLASGSFGHAKQSTASPKPSSATSSSDSTPSEVADAGYSLLLQGHLYKVKTSGTAGPNQQHLFFDEKSSQVTDKCILQQLASAAWTRENVILSPDARNGSRRVSGILGTSKAIQGYTTIQDVFARAMVEALEAAVTDGASLAKALPSLGKGVAINQLKNAPKTVFVLTAQRGLEQSLAAYQQMENVPLPPNDATVLNAPDLLRIKNYYFQARTLELPYGALAAKLMPTSGTELTNQALASAISELIPAAGLNQVDTVTLQNLLTFQKSVSNLSQTLPPLQAFSQNLNLAIDLTNANNRTISQWAGMAAQGSCEQH